MDALSIFALLILVATIIILSYGLIIIHDIPYHIALKRNHPHADAIHTAGWVSLFTLHVIWPFLWIWATLYREDRGYGFDQDADGKEAADPAGASQQLQARVEKLEKALAALRSSPASPPPSSTKPGV